MAYRTSAHTNESKDTAVCCARCGALTSLALEPNRSGRFECRKCQYDQLVLRDVDDLALEELKLTDYGIGSYEELERIRREVALSGKPV